MTRPGRHFAMLVFVGIALSPAIAQSPPLLPTGKVIDRVICQADPAESYALYLPSGYNPAQRWPIIFIFDPLARGQVPVKLYREIAEKYGYILAGSNNSRNFSMEAASKAANAVWQDTHARLSLDERQVYTAGFSGGARVAGLVATRCTPCRIAGVIAQGAGYPVTDRPSGKDGLYYFFSVGDEDFNWPEIVQARRQREDVGSPYRVRVFSGSHQWAPPEIMDDAVAWIRLKAMQAGVQPKDGDFVEKQFGRMKAEAVEAETRKDAIAQLSAYRSLVSDFDGLENVSEYQKRLAALRQSSALQKALKLEQQQIADQAAITADLSAKLGAFNDVPMDQKLGLRTDIIDGMGQLKSQAEHAKSDRRLVLLRAFNDLWAQGIEAGQAEFEKKHFDNAESYFQLMCDIPPLQAWPSLLLAETRAATGNKKQAVKDIREAIRRGLKNPQVLEQDPNLEPLRHDPEFLKIIAELKAE